MVTPEQITPATNHALLVQLVKSNDLLTRAIMGEEKSGNKGLLQRVDSLETKVSRLIMALPVALLGGSALGKVASDYLGL